MNSQIKQEAVNKAVWAACDTFRGTVSADIYKDYVLTLLFLKYLSDVWQDHMDVYARDYGEPRNAVLYIDKKLEQHNLIQAIARVNRLHEQKKFGLLIDYRGILRALDTAMSEYQDLAERTQGGFDIDDIDGLYADISTEYKRLPALHDALWGLFASVRNKADFEQYRQLLVPRFENDMDANQKVREDFYAALTGFGLCLRTALGSRSFFEDASVTEAMIATYKKDLKFFDELRKISRQDAQETIDFSAYEDQITKLVDRYVLGEKITGDGGVFLVNELGRKQDPESWSAEKTRNETDTIRSRLTKTIAQELADDPYAQTHFSELLRQAIADADALFEHPFKQYALFRDIEERVQSRTINGAPEELAASRHASAYFGIFRLICGDAQALGANRESYINAAREIEAAVQVAVAENSLNPQNIETAIRKTLLPMLFNLIGLDHAKQVIDQIVSVTRIGLSRGNA